MPSMNEEETIRICIEKAQYILKKYNIAGEIIVADNSSDRTAEIAVAMGAKVIGPCKGIWERLPQRTCSGKGELYCYFRCGQYIRFARA